MVPFQAVRFVQNASLRANCSGFGIGLHGDHDHLEALDCVRAFVAVYGFFPMVLF